MRPNTNEVYFSNIATQKIIASKNNPRRIFDQSHISELAQSFSEYGIIQPIIVYKKNTQYTIICGERRWRAAKLAEIKDVPAIIHPVPPKDDIAVSMALIENMHRQNVDLVSESTAIQSLVLDFGWEKKKIAKELGVSLAYIRSRIKLTKYDDILTVFNKEKISFSEAVELSTLSDKKERRYFLRKLLNDDFSDYKAFLAAVSRHKIIQKVILKGYFLKQPLVERKISFSVKGLPYCDASCKNYLKLTWEEKKRYKISTNMSGWSEYCTEPNCDCYSQKNESKKKYLNSLRKIELNKPIPYDGWESMQWFVYRKKTCNACNFFIDSSDFELAGILIDKNIHAFCTSQDESCFSRRREAYFKNSWNRKKLIEKEKALNKIKVLKRISEKKTTSKSSNNSYITKVEAAYLILSFLCYAGGRERLKYFAEKNYLTKNLPSTYAAQVTYIKNKLIETFKDERLMEILFDEAAASAAYNQQKLVPRCFDRKTQKEILINDTEQIVEI